MRRINVKGISGSGKSTFAKELARRLELPYIELDAQHYGPNWSEPTAEEFRVKVQQAIDAASDGWVIDGNYEGKLGSLVIYAADTIVWLDLPFLLKARRLLRRTAHQTVTTSSSGAETRRTGGTSSSAGTRSSGGW